MLALTLAVLVVAAVGALLSIGGAWRLTRLERLAPERFDDPPLVSIIVAARDEADTLAPALRTLLAQDWPALEVLVVDDRSTDATGEVATRIAAEDSRLTVLRVDALPDGWLGKTHAMHVAGQRARGQWWLYTDADVLMHPDTLSRAMTLARAGGLDHLTLVPRLVAHGALLRAVLLPLTAGIFLRFMAWRGRGFAVGAFNLVRADAWRQAGGHAAIAMAVVDDMALGARLARSGARQAVASGAEHVAVEWYPDLGRLARGLEKNALAGCGYSVTGAGVLVVLLALVNVVPWVALAVGVSRADAGLITAALLALGALVLPAMLWASRLRWGWGWLAWWPLAGPLAAALIARAVWLTIARGGIVWRGTFHSLETLRRP